MPGIHEFATLDGSLAAGDRIDLNALRLGEANFVALHANLQGRFILQQW